MMSDKPFPCPNKGCCMTFTNEDHLNVHRKKHEMVLNLGLIPKNNTVADQTPTPTRFIRNCEEVGLFQDLQNVNPFEETFKKALELPKSGHLSVSQSNSDDTLHTPNILPHLPQVTVTSTPSKHSCSDSDEAEFNLAEHIVLVISDDEVDGVTEQSDSEIENIQNPNRVSIMEKLKHALNNSKHLNQSSRHNCDMKRPPEATTKRLQEPNSKLRRRENNRAAQYRCRLKRKTMNQELQRQIDQLSRENKKLETENQQLRFELSSAAKVLLKHKECQFEGEDVVMPDIHRAMPSLKHRTMPSPKDNAERVIMPKLDQAKPMNTIVIQTLADQPQPTQIHIVLPGQVIMPNNSLEESVNDEDKCAINNTKPAGHHRRVNILKKS